MNGGRMPSVRDKIEAFESISKKDNEDPPRESGKGPPKKEGRRFLLPKSTSKPGKSEGSSTTLDQIFHRPPSGTSRSSGHLTVDFQSCLDEVWSVKKNVCVNPSRQTKSNLTGKPTVTTSNPGTRLYSRHSAMSMAATSANNTKNIGSSRSISFLKKDGNVPVITPLREQNRSSESGKRPLNTPTNDLSPPQAKRKTFNAMGLLPTQTQNNKKTQYAEKMAAAYRLQGGFGEFTPETDKYVQTKPAEHGFSSQWVQKDQNSMDDEFDF